MADFSELCTLFKTGLIHDMIFPEPIVIRATTTSQPAITYVFGRSVIFTDLDAIITASTVGHSSTTAVIAAYKNYVSAGAEIASVSITHAKVAGELCAGAATDTSFAATDTLYIKLKTNASGSVVTGKAFAAIRFKDA